MNIFKFRKKSVLSEPDRIFQTQTFIWLLNNFDKQEFYKNTRLVLPNKQFFPDESSGSDELVALTFRKVKEYAGMPDWPCELIKFDEDIKPYISESLILENTPKNPHGSILINGRDGATIKYNPALINNPTKLVATFAHELSHYLTCNCKEDPPGGWENWEFVTDVTAVFLGFGIFMANAHFEFVQDLTGWRHESSGYLSAAEYSFALATFCGLKKIDMKYVFPYLNKNIKTLYRRSVHEVSELNVVEEIQKATTDI